MTLIALYTHKHTHMYTYIYTLLNCKHLITNYNWCPKQYLGHFGYVIPVAKSGQHMNSEMEKMSFSPVNRWVEKQDIKGKYLTLGCLIIIT